ncbi:DUF1905 domain-containing protein [Candidatus Kaiserbacteria bacterium]|nr:DUF1905 domain-containing protein [Candidatus Kaiserbacteria bacterium]
MAKRSYTVNAKVWLYPGEHASWHFVSVDKKQSTDIKERYGKYAKGFRSIPVRVTIGKTTWDTSLFPDSKSGMYILPLKASVRRAEGVLEGETIDVVIQVR